MIRLLAIVLLLLVSSNCKKTGEPSPEAIVCRSFATECYDWSQELTEDGRVVGQMIADTANGTPVDRRLFEAALTTFEKKVEIKAEEYEAVTLPQIAALQTCRTIVVDYLRWQASEPMNSMRQAMELAHDPSLSRDAKKDGIMRILTKSVEQERVWKDRMTVAVDELEEWVKQNG